LELGINSERKSDTDELVKLYNEAIHNKNIAIKGFELKE